MDARAGPPEGRLAQGQKLRKLALNNTRRTKDRAQQFDNEPASLEALHNSLKATRAEKARLEGKGEKRRKCRANKAFYQCANGFEGCCSVDACALGGTCPDGPKHRTKNVESTTPVQKPTSIFTTTSVTVVTTTATTLASKTSTLSSKPQLTTAQTKPSGPKTTGTTKTTSPASSTSTISVPLPPACPAGNGTTYADSSKTKYTIHCDTDNTYSSYQTNQVKVGGYAECFSACSNTQYCAGFTFLGLDSGGCYLKTQMPEALYTIKDGGGHVSCAKANATAPATGAPTSGSSAKNRIVTIVCGVLGGVVVIILLLLLIAILARRHRKKIEQRRATVTHSIQVPYESDRLNFTGHQREGSSSHDVFQPFGGFYRGWSKSHPDIPEQNDPPDQWQGEAPRDPRPDPGTELVPLIYQPSMIQQQGVVPMPDAATFRPQSGSRSPRFREHLDGNEGYQVPPRNVFNASPSNDSPTLGRLRMTAPSSPLADQVRRQQMQNSAYRTPSKSDAQHGSVSTSETNANSNTAYSPRTRSPVSPVSNHDPLDSDFAVSPLFNSHKKDKYWNGYTGHA